jgi:hypothetical protein
MVDNYNKLNFSRPLAFKSNLDLNKLSIFPPFTVKKLNKPNIDPAAVVDIKPTQKVLPPVPPKI